MKQLAAILLLGIFSFNIFGYQLVAYFMESKANTAIELALDENNYADQELILIKQPINLPYYQNSKTFRRIDGETEIAGIYYKYVKCRIYNDSLELLCIPNRGKMKILETKADFSKLVADFQQSANKKKNHSDSKLFQKAISEYEEQACANNTFKPNLATSNYLIPNNLFINRLFKLSVEQPPDPAFHNSQV